MASTSKSDNLTKTLEFVQQRKGRGTGAYVQGLLSFGVLLVTIGLVIFLFVPLIRDAQTIAVRRAGIEREVDALKKKYATISGYDKVALADNLSNARILIPDNIRVAELATFINVNATSFGLTVSRLGIDEDRSEVKQVTEVEERDRLLGPQLQTPVFLGRVQGPFAFRGSRDNIFRFLDFLVTGGYATNFDQVTVTAGSTEDSWGVSFFTSYYYLQPVENLPPSFELLEVNTDALRPITIRTPGATPGVDDLSE
ncbi:MAG: hypothetical protein QY312_04415 [Candidatus Dojkabacteria bacterium]|nr:MAG: hypothetical protein QY312_04415 [Candidatus Dojkabacteria bacterium]